MTKGEMAEEARAQIFHHARRLTRDFQAIADLLTEEERTLFREHLHCSYGKGIRQKVKDLAMAKHILDTSVAYIARLEAVLAEGFEGSPCAVQAQKRSVLEIVELNQRDVLRQRQRIKELQAWNPYAEGDFTPCESLTPESSEDRAGSAEPSRKSE